MLDWLDQNALFEEANKAIKTKRRTAPSIDEGAVLFVAKARTLWQEAIDLRGDEVAEMVGLGLAQPVPSILYHRFGADLIPLMPPTGLIEDGQPPASDLDKLTEEQRAAFDEKYADDTDPRGWPCSLYGHVLTLHMARLIRKTWGGSRQEACATLRLWDKEWKRGELLQRLLLEAIFGPEPDFDAEAARNWYVQRRNLPVSAEMLGEPVSSPPHLKAIKAKPKRKPAPVHETQAALFALDMVDKA